MVSKAALGRVVIVGRRGQGGTVTNPPEKKMAVDLKKT